MSFTRKEILEVIYSYIPKNLENEEIIWLNDENTRIRIGTHQYLPVRNNTGELCFFERKKNRKTKEEYLHLVPKHNQIEKKKIKTLTGKITIGVASVLLLGASFLMIKKHLEEQEKKDSKPRIESAGYNNSEIKIENITLEEEQENLETKDNGVISLEAEINPTDYLGFLKRERLIEKYGFLIGEAANKYGQDINFMINLFSRESHNEKDDVPEEQKENIGQLTSVVCTEPIVTPVFQNNQIIGQEGFFILPENYPGSPKTLEEINPEYLTDIQKDNLKRAKNTNANWNVYTKSQAFYNHEINIKVSTAYLSYLVNKKQDLLLGAMSYHAGYSKTYGLTREDVVNGNIEAQDANYITNILQYEPLENYNGGFFYTVMLQNGEIKTYEIKSQRLESELGYEKENGYSL